MDTHMFTILFLTLLNQQCPTHFIIAGIFSFAQVSVLSVSHPLPEEDIDFNIFLFKYLFMLFHCP